MPKLLLFIFLLLFTTIPSKADSINTVSASGSFVGVAATETFDTSFNWDVTTSAVVPNSMTYSTSGPLGLFSFYGANPQGGVASWIDALGDYIQINFYDHATPATFDTIGTFTPVNVEMYCASYGSLTNHVPCLGGPFSSFESHTGGVTIVDPPDTVPVPEPSSWLMSIAGIMSLLALKRRMV